MDTLIVLSVAGVLTCWAIAAYSIWRWGPGIRRRSVHCPNLKVRAKVEADQRQAEFACLCVIEIRGCSLIPSRMPSCGKECIARV